MSEFHFLRPWWLLALLPLALGIVRLVRRAAVRGDWSRVCDTELLPHILIDRPVSGGGHRLPLWLGIGGTLAIVALAGPVWERSPAPVFRNQAALVIALDLSLTMDAGDVKPSRLERARFKIADILHGRKDGQTALLVYAGDAFTVTPLTDDVETIASQLSALSTGLMPARGGRPDLALSRSADLLRQAGLVDGDILLVTSGTSAEHAVSMAKQVHSDGFRVSVLGAGTEDGAPIPLPGGGFLSNEKGGMQIARLDSTALGRLAEAGGGVYRTMGSDGTDVAMLSDFFGHSAERGEVGDAKLKLDQWRERGPWLLLALLPIAALAFRRGVIVALLLAVLSPRPADALEWRDLWQTRDQRARDALDAGDAKTAAETFEHPGWRAAAQYRAGRFDDAAKTLESAEGADAAYNRGNALAKAGQYPEAIKAYEAALQRDPNHADARFNKDLVEQALKEQQQKDKQQDKQKSDHDGDKDQRQTSDQKGDKDQAQSDADQDQRQDQQHQDAPQQQDASEPRPGEQSGQSDKAEGQQQDAGDKTSDQTKPAESGRPQPSEQAPQGKDEHAEMEQRGDREDRQAVEQWLRRIPDDPGGLLKRKFYYQYQQRQRRGVTR